MWVAHYNYPPCKAPTPYITIQFIEFTYCSDKFTANTLERKKTTKNQLLINSVTLRGWNLAPLMVLVAGARATTYIPSLKELETNLKLPTMKIKNAFKRINMIAI